MNQLNKNDKNESFDIDSMFKTLKEKYNDSARFISFFWFCVFLFFFFCFFMNIIIISIAIKISINFILVFIFLLNQNFDNY